MTQAKSCVYLSDAPDTSLRGKTVLVRADFNVLDETTGELKSDRRIAKTIPTINHIRSRGGKIVLMTHVGRPKGKLVTHLRTDPIALRLSVLADIPVTKIDEVSGPSVTDLIRSMRIGEIVLLENVRFAPGKTAGSIELAHAWAAIADAYIFDAFGAGHRPQHASVDIVADVMRGQGNLVAKGLLVEEEERNLNRILSPERPLAIVFGGGTKAVSEKIATLQTLMARLAVGDAVLIGGLLGNWLREKAQARLLRGMESIARNRSATLICTRNPRTNNGRDIDEGTVVSFESVIEHCRTVSWNGPLGIYEDDRYRVGTRRLAECIAARTEAGMLRSVLGGGDTEAAIAACGLRETDFTFVSTGGGASLLYLENGSLPVDQHLSSPEAV